MPSPYDKANDRIFYACQLVGIGPPEIDPSLSLVLYLWPRVTSTNLVVIPKIAVIHIQNIAAGPPVHIANATPPIFPVPTAPDIAVVSAWNPVFLRQTQNF